jgi:poly-beta-1,6-N-acetyl-D-glucosamine synthase
MAALSYAIVTPARNEAENLVALAACLAEQTVPFARWVIVDNGSTDETVHVARGIAAGDPRVSVIGAAGEAVPTRGGPVAKAFTAGIEALELVPDVVVKVDADITVNASYFEELLAEFVADPSLGIGGGICYELEDGSWVPRHQTGNRVRGASRAYRWACLQDVLPLENRPGWDGIDELRAAAAGWRTASFPGLRFDHHRAVGLRDASRRVRLYETGRSTYFSGYRPSYLVMRSLYKARREPIAVAMIAGYASAWARREPRVDAAARAEVRREQSFRRLPLRIREALGR